MQETMRVKTSQKFEVVDLTAKVADAVGRSGVVEGLCTVFVRHATAAIVINENADAGFRHDIIAALDKLFPQGVWQHDKVDDNGAAHLKSTRLNSSHGYISYAVFCLKKKNKTTAKGTGPASARYKAIDTLAHV